jgi:hypothetical protein
MIKFFIKEEDTMIKKIFTALGVGLLGGIGTRCGVMLVETLFPNGFGGLLSRFTNRNKKEENRTTYSSTTGNPPIRDLQRICGRRDY